MPAFPPHRSRASRPISSAAALAILQPYLADSAAHAHLQPNATLHATGPAVQEAASNLIMDNLRRVEAGLRGEWLAPRLELEGAGAAEAGGREEEVDPFADAVGADAEAARKAAQREGWQDLAEYQREQSYVEGEIGPRDTALVQEEGHPGLLDVNVPTETDNKEARKKRKQERQKREKMGRHALNSSSKMDE
ncbi:MAG: hypothetical protein M1818_006388 [Claussenomyces sp. TS43310]|nr:MAG: hypothetical protein M1818_006388 [Claussenomyces sp. TS43310]